MGTQTPSSDDDADFWQSVKTNEHTNQLFSYKLNRTSSSHPKRRVKVQRVHVSDDDVAFFQEKGYFVAGQMVDVETLQYLRDEFGRMFHGHIDFDGVPQEFEFWMSVVGQHKADHKAVRKINNSWWINDAMRQLVHSSAIGEVAAKLLNTPEIRLWHDQAIWKPGVGPTATNQDAEAGNIGWHQDYGLASQ